MSQTDDKETLVRMALGFNPYDPKDISLEELRKQALAMSGHDATAGRTSNEQLIWGAQDFDAVRKGVYEAAEMERQLRAEIDPVTGENSWDAYRRIIKGGTL